MRNQEDVYMTIRHTKREKRARVNFKVVLQKVVVSAVILTSIATSTIATPVYAANNLLPARNSVSVNYELDLANIVHSTNEVIGVIEGMIEKGTVSKETLERLANHISDLERVVEQTNNGTTRDVVNVIRKAETVLNKVSRGTEGLAKAQASVVVAKMNLNIKDNVDVEVKNNSSQNVKVKLSDISNHWGRENIEFLVNRGAISGYSDGTFKPNNTISFAEFLAIAMRSVVPADQMKAPEGSHWALGFYNKAVELGIFYRSDFKESALLEKTISREDMALILININEVAQKESKIDTSTTRGKIQDYTTISSNRRYFVEQAYQKGLIAGKGNGFDPQGNLTRAEAATIVARILDSSKRVSVSDSKQVVNKERAPMTLRYDDPRRPMAIEGDTFITADGREVVLKVGPSGVLGEGQGVATEIGRAHPNGKLIKHGDLGSNEKYLGQPYYVDSKTGEGHYRQDWDEISERLYKEAVKIANPKDGQVYENWFYYEGGQWYWIGPSQNSR